MNEISVSGNIVDIHSRTIFKGSVVLADGKIKAIKQDNSVQSDRYIIPGLIDSHIHIESSMLVPTEFAKAAVCHGTVAAVTDPHEICNVMGISGLDFMLDNAAKSPMQFYFGAPSCVPATGFETSGANIDSEQIDAIFEKHNLKYLSEMMNFPGVIFEDPEVYLKLNSARSRNKPIDGHAPGLSGEQLRKYVSAGITTDHECFTEAEAEEKIKLGMKILIREGSAAKNFDALIPLIDKYPDMIMFSSDDKHPDDLIAGHINLLVSKAVKSGYNLFNVLRAATINPIEHYKLETGALRIGESADFALVDNLTDFNIIETYINGNKVYSNGKSLIKTEIQAPVNKFVATAKSVNDFAIAAQSEIIRVIKAIDGELITEELICKAKVNDNQLVSDTSRDILKLAVINRYQDTAPAIGFINGIGIKKGAIATSVAHDSHNIIAVGCDDEFLAAAVNAVIESKGGMAVYSDGVCEVLPLPVAGLMSNEPAVAVAEKYAALNIKAKAIGSKLNAPFMTLSFMALLVIPALKLSDKGLFDGKSFEFVSLNV